MSVAVLQLSTRPRAWRSPWPAYGLLGVLALAYALATVAGHGERPLAAATALVVAFGAAALTFVRAAARPVERLAWTAIGTALLAWAVGDLLVRLSTAGGAELPIPSLADAVYLLFFPLAAAGLLLLARARVRVANGVVWLDGLIAALTIAAACALLLIEPLGAVGGESSAQLATNLAYPISDLVLALAAAGYVGLRCGRLDRGALLLTGGLLLSAGADGLYLYETARGPYDEGGLLTNGYLFASLLIGAAAWQPAEPLAVLREERQRIVAPLVCGAACVAILLADHHERAETIAVWLAAAALAAVLARFALTFRSARRLLDARDREALTDHVTGLRNRRALMRDLALAAAADGGPGHQLVLLDLDGFKRFNDTFGHLAGDALLARAGRRLDAAAAAAGGFAYRMGGDEFCLLAPCAGAPTADTGAVDVPAGDAPAAGPAGALAARAAAALGERGDGFDVAASCGDATLVPGERDPERALRAADERMYAQKAARRAVT
jgi:diguanylate cyclase (GGDEF)-like protein